MTIKTRNILILLFGWAVIFCLLFCSCGERVELNYEKLEAQYVELTPYWNYILKNRLNTDTSARFSVLYKECRTYWRNIKIQQGTFQQEVCQTQRAEQTR